MSCEPQQLKTFGCSPTCNYLLGKLLMKTFT
ncbi:TPA: 50S ribosomal protein L13, partial [Escherichia coli]|nr:50S ribosomal protein L13 [Escherichia coli]